MMTYWLEKWGRIAAHWAVAAFFVSLSILIWRTPNVLLHLDGTLTRTEATLSKANATLSNLDKGTKVWADDSKQESDEIAGLVTQARGTLSGAQQAFESIPVTLTHIQGTADASTSLLTSAQRTVDTFPPLVGDIRTSVEGIAPLEAKTGDAIDSLNALLKDQAIHRTIANVAGITEQSNAILTDFRQVADKERADWLRPVPWWKRPLAKGGQLIDIGAAVARHAP